MCICVYSNFREDTIGRSKNRTEPQRSGQEGGCVMVRILLPILIGAALGAAMGYFGQCTSGTCPLTSTWWRGALYGATLGGLFAFSSNR